MTVSRDGEKEIDAVELGYNSSLKLFVEDAQRIGSADDMTEDSIPEASLMAPAH